MSYKIITRPDAVAWYASLQQGINFDVKVNVSNTNVGISGESHLMSRIISSLDVVKKKYLDKQFDEKRLEYEVGKIIFNELKNVSHNILTDGNYWRWFTIAHTEMLELAVLRHGKNLDTVNEVQMVNLGIGNIREGFYSRAWMRIYLSYDENMKDPFSLACRGDQDFWRSHILRQSYAKSPAMVRALIRFQYADSDNLPRLKASGNSDLGIRRLVRDLSASLSTIAIDAFDEDEAFEFIETLYKKMELAQTISEGV